jgi:hypothetical protein
MGFSIDAALVRLTEGKAVRRRPKVMTINAY